MVDTCPHCGSVILGDYPEPLFSPQKMRLLNFIRSNPGCRRQEIIDYLYPAQAKPDFNVVSVMLNQMQDTLRAKSLRIITRRGPGATYRLVKEPSNVVL